LWGKYSALGTVQFINVALDRQTLEQLQSAINADPNMKRLAYPVVLGESTDWSSYVAKYVLSKVISSEDIPGITIIDQSGKIYAIHHGSQVVPENVAWVEKTVDALLAR
jgi:hypothetical protein